DRAPGGAPRTARLTLSFRSKDPYLALAVTRELGQLVIQHELTTRREQALDAAASAERERDLLVGALAQRTRQIFVKQKEIGDQKPDPRLQVELVSMLGSLGALEHQAEAAERRAATLDLAAAFERRGIGLHFEVVDEGALPAEHHRLLARVL